MGFKDILVLSILCLLLSACPKNRNVFPDSLISVSVSDQKEIHVGDTVWVESVVKSSDLGIGNDANFDQDRYDLDLNLYLKDTTGIRSKNYSLEEEQVERGATYTLLTPKASLGHSFDMMRYVYQSINHTYELKLGFVMKKKGKFSFLNVYSSTSTLCVLGISPKSGKGRGLVIPLNFNKSPISGSYSIEVK